MSRINFIYPLADIHHPTTGGQVYDQRLFNEFRTLGKRTILWNNNKLRIQSRKELFFALIKIIRKFKNDEIVIFNSALFIYFLPFLILMHHKKRLTVFAIHHHFRFFEFKGMQRWIRKLLEIKTLKMCDGVISPNPYTTDLLMRFMPEKNIKNLRMSFAPQTEDSHPQKGEFLYVGTIYKRKGVHKLIEALSKLYKKGIRDFNLNLVGSIHHKEYVDQIKQLIVSNHLENNIHILGRVSRDELGELYSNAEWFILPSQHEGYGMVIAEAMSYGVPVIAFDNSAIPYIVKDNVNGLLV